MKLRDVAAASPKLQINFEETSNLNSAKLTKRKMTHAGIFVASARRGYIS
jgi:hypothetical protein